MVLTYPTQVIDPLDGSVTLHHAVVGPTPVDLNDLPRI
jgi:hypothetical protein